MAYTYDPNARYAETHDWVRMEDDLAICGISDFAQSELSDVVYVELPEVGDMVVRGNVYSTIESVKAAEEVYAPVSGEIVAINELLDDTPELINDDPFGQAWIIKVRPSDPGELDQLMTVEAYQALVAKLEDAGGH